MAIRTCEEHVGRGIVARWRARAGGGFEGRCVRKGVAGDLLTDDDEARLRQRLRLDAGKLEPNYTGIDGAIARFLRFMPGGFAGDRYQEKEREYKDRARAALQSALPLDRAADATAADALALHDARVWTNLLDRFEAMPLKQTLKSPKGADWLRAAARFTRGDHAGGLTAMAAAMDGGRRLSWPMATYLPFLWEPQRHMFLKPEVTKDFAERTGDPFFRLYDASPDAAVYRDLLRLAETTERDIAALEPDGRIDVQGFIWVVGGYRDKDLPGSGPG